MISIYDFGIFPYALGDVLTWSIKQSVKALESKDDRLDIFLCNEDSNFYQEKNVDQRNSNSFLNDLLPTFYCNPMVNDIHIFQNRNRMMARLTGEDLLTHEFKVRNKNNWEVLNRILFNEVSSHREIIEFYEKNKMVPQLVSPIGFDFKHIINNKIVIAIHLRGRKRDQSLGMTEEHRDADINVWREALLCIGIIRPDVMFILLGKCSENDPSILELKNVESLRHNGGTLAQELFLIKNCNGFMGSVSGFSEMAILSGSNCCLFNPDQRSYNNWGLNYGDTNNRYGNPNQHIIEGKETVEKITNSFYKIINL